MSADIINPKWLNLTSVLQQIVCFKDIPIFFLATGTLEYLLLFDYERSQQTHASIQTKQLSSDKL